MNKKTEAKLKCARQLLRALKKMVDLHSSGPVVILSDKAAFQMVTVRRASDAIKRANRILGR